MLLRPLWQCVRNSTETTSKKTATLKKGKAEQTETAKGNETGEGQSVTGIVFALINHKVDAPMTASSGMYSASTSWSMSDWMKLVFDIYKYVRKAFGNL